MSPAEHRRIAFIFPMASGHINPSLPVARHLITLGHKVHYLCREQMREAIEDTGAVFHNEIPLCPEMYEGRSAGLFGAFDDLKKEYGLEDHGLIRSMMKMREVMLELMLPGVLRWLCMIKAEAVVYCPLMNHEAAFAARILGLPGVGILTTAGPGSGKKVMGEMMAYEGVTPKELLQESEEFEPRNAARQRIRAAYGLEPDTSRGLKTLGWIESVATSYSTLITTSEDLADPLEGELLEAYKAVLPTFKYVGPLLDQAGARRAGVHKFSPEEATAPDARSHSDEEAMAVFKAAKAAGRKVIFVSMGTVITGDSPDFGWSSKLRGADGVPKGLTGSQLCRAAWAGAFDAFGAAAEDPAAAQLFVSLGPQPDALGDLQAPANAFCRPMLPQVDLLKAGVDLFLTHGGQNSFMESLSVGVPVVVCPGFADQPVNARKAADLGVGLKVDRPIPEDGEEEAAATEYRAEVAAALQRVMSEESFRAAARRCSVGLRDAGGVQRAADTILEAAAIGSAVCCRGEKWAQFSKVAEIVEGSPRAAVKAGA